MSISCKGCTKRYVGCHSSCEIYAEYHEERQRIAKKRLEYVQLEQDKARRGFELAKGVHWKRKGNLK